MPYTEANYENAVIEVFRATLGYGYTYGPDIARDYAEPLYMDELLPALRRVNPKLPEPAITEAVYKLRNFEGGTVLRRNIQFMDYLQNGVSVNYFDKGEQLAALARLVDYGNLDRNTFTVANQWTITGNSEKRPDVIVFLNGLPVVVFELKSPSREETDASEAFRQLRDYMIEIPSLFIYNAFCVLSDLATSKAGTITADEDRFMEWKTKDGSYENTQYAQFDTFIEGMFDKRKFEESTEALSDRRNIIVMADEARRGQYGLDEKVDAKTGRVILGTARVIRDSLPNATYIGFTGTPISSKDRSTIEVFGNYIDIYDMTQAVEDGATRPVHYESRVIHLRLDEDILRLIDAEYDARALSICSPTRTRVSLSSTRSSLRKSLNGRRDRDRYRAMRDVDGRLSVNSRQTTMGVRGCPCPFRRVTPSVTATM
jgi:type I site-specific restriction-modification system R (restriction) subunit